MDQAREEGPDGDPAVGQRRTAQGRRLAGPDRLHRHLEAPSRRATLARRLNIDGAGQGDLSGHGGEQRAVLVYQIESYRHWQNHLGRDDFELGQFGRISPSTGCSTTRCASVTVTASATPNSK
jgi:hypothetical protein